MANRGRGRGNASMSISTEQLGFGRDDPPPPLVLQPPAKYPLLEYKPTPFELTTELSYLLEIKRDYAEFIRESPSGVQSVIVKKDIERYSDRYQDMVADKVSYQDRYDWTRLPNELKPSQLKRKAAAKGDKVPQKKPKKKKDIDILKKLEKLEQKENTQNSDAEDDSNVEEDGEEKEEGEAPEGEDVEQMDEEMEDDTDYVNNYFDNGEGYDDDEDNLDEGPVY